MKYYWCFVEVPVINLRFYELEPCNVAFIGKYAKLGFISSLHNIDWSNNTYLTYMYYNENEYENIEDVCNSHVTCGIFKANRAAMTRSFHAVSVLFDNIPNSMIPKYVERQIIQYPTNIIQFKIYCRC